jgi:RNA polymerase sigma-70 factor, ECF subfamily
MNKRNNEPLIVEHDSKTRDHFIDIYSDYFPLIYGLVYAKIADRDEAKDVCQEIFIRLYERLNSIDDVRKWLYGTMKNVIFEFYKKKTRNDSVNIDDILSDAGIGYVNGFRDTRLVINDALENMENFRNPKEKIIFDLIAINMFTYTEAAEHMGMTPRQVQYAYGLIVDRILNYLSKKGIKAIEDLL